MKAKQMIKKLTLATAVIALAMLTAYIAFNKAVQPLRGHSRELVEVPRDTIRDAVLSYASNDKSMHVAKQDSREQIYNLDGGKGWKPMTATVIYTPLEASST